MGKIITTNGSVIGATSPLTDSRTILLTAHEAFTAGQVGYLHSDGEVHLADASAYATAEGLLVMAMGTIAANAQGLWLLQGPIAIAGLTAGSPYVVSQTAGAILTLAAFQAAWVTGDQQRRVGYALTTGILMFDPDGTIEEYVA